MRPHNLRHQPVNCLLAIMAAHGKAYCYPSQETLLELMERYWNTSISRRQLNRWLADLQEAGIIQRIRRHKRGRTGALELHSTLYRVTYSGHKWIGKIGRGLSRAMHKAADAATRALRSAGRAPQSQAPCAVSGMAQQPDSPGGSVGTAPPSGGADAGNQSVAGLALLRELRRSIRPQR